MKEFIVGLRFGGEAGIAFFGLDEANFAIQEGAKVMAIKPGEAIFHKIGEDQDNVRMTLAGFTIKIVINE